ncbi:OmpA family protein [Halomonadaceae bacterium KBTZ08]
MRRRRTDDEEGPSNDRWLVSYADFVTVLFGFFVFLYALSNAEHAEVQRLSEAVQGVFSGKPRTINPIPIGEPITAPDESSGTGAPRFSEPELRDALGNALDGVAEGERIRFREGKRWLEVTLPGDLVFSSGGVRPGKAAKAAIVRIAEVLASNDNAIVVEGYTDNLPISTSRFPSNWELSAARAGAVVRLLEANGIEPERLAALGYGDNHPVARNDTERGRARNRRVTLVIGAEGSPPAAPGQR